MILCANAHAITCIHNFTKHVQEAILDDEVMYELTDVEFRDKKTKVMHLDKTKRAVYNELAKVKDLNDYSYWEAHLGRFLDSKPSRNGHSTLDEFF